MNPRWLVGKTIARVDTQPFPDGRGDYGFQRAVVLYFGDHDPDGWEIPRSALRNVKRLMATREIDFDVEFRRIALNRDQVDEYDCPPFEAKITSARYRGYVEEHETEDAWELDALDPLVLRKLIRDEVDGYFDVEVYDREQLRAKGLQNGLRKLMRDPEWMRLALADEL